MMAFGDATHIPLESVLFAQGAHKQGSRLQVESGQVRGRWQASQKDGIPISPIFRFLCYITSLGPSVLFSDTGYSLHLVSLGHCLIGSGIRRIQ